MSYHPTCPLAYFKIYEEDDAYQVKQLVSQVGHQAYIYSFQDNGRI